MKRITRHVLALSAAALLGPTAALANPGLGMPDGGCPAMGQEALGHPGPRTERWQQRMARHMEQRQAALKAALKLTPQQEADWTQLHSAMTAPTHPMTTPEQRAEWNQWSTPERLDKMQALHQARWQAMQQRTDAIKRFYATLTPTQQQTFDRFHQLPMRPAKPAAPATKP